MSAHDDSRSPRETARKKARRNVQKACDNCRHRRVKCDGVQPSCGTCAVYKDDCQWDSREDYRKPLPRQQVQALVTRVQDLERLLKEHGIEMESAPTQRSSGKGSIGSVKEQVSRDLGDDGDDPRDLSLDHLVEREDGNVYLHGPTSAFRHLGKHPRGQASGLNIYPVPISRGPPQFGHSRFLPSVIQLSKAEHDQCLDRFFGYYACWGMRSNALLFKHDMNLALSHPYPRTAHYSPMLHNAILAIALGFSDDPYLRQSSTRAVFGMQAKSFIDEEGMTPSVATVQAFAHIASYHSLGAEHNLGWLYIGMASRCAIALGLNTDCTHLLERGHIPVDQAKERNTTFWTIFVQEGVWAPYIGRAMSTQPYTTRLPDVDTELDQLEWRPITPGTSGVLSSQPGFLSTTFVHTVKLMLIGERIMNTLYGIKGPVSSRQRNAAISDISIALEEWLVDLPPPLALDIQSPFNALPHILMMHLSHAWLAILLYRPFYRPFAGMSSSEKTDGAGASQPSRAAWAVKQCDHAAIRVIHLLRIWHTYHDLRFSPPTALQVSFVAGTTNLLSLASARSNSRQEAESLSRVNECLKLLQLIAVSWPAAEQACMLLDGLREEYGFSSAGATLRKDEVENTVLYDTSLRHSSTLTQQPLPGQNDGYGGPGLSSQITRSAPSHIQSQFDPTLATGFATDQIAPEDHGQINDLIPNHEAHLLQTSESDWDQFDLGLGLDAGDLDQTQVDPELQALLDRILQPHLHVGIGGYDTGFALP